MASTSAPQQGNLPTEVMPQVGDLSHCQITQILRNLPGLLEKVNYQSTAGPLCILLSLAMRLVNAICELGHMAQIAVDRMTFRSLEPHVIALILSAFQHNMPTAFLFSIVVLVLMTLCQ